MKYIALKVIAWTIAGLLAFHIVQSAKRVNMALSTASSIPKQERAK